MQWTDEPFSTLPRDEALKRERTYAIPYVETLGSIMTLIATFENTRRNEPAELSGEEIYLLSKAGSEMGPLGNLASDVFRWQRIYLRQRWGIEEFG